MSKRASKSKGRKGTATGRKPGQVDLSIQPTLGPRGRGRPRALTRPMLEDVCRLLAMGLSVVRSCRASGMVRSQYYLWKAQGEADAAAGRKSIEAEFSDMVDIYEAVGAAGLWGRAVAGTVITKPGPDGRPVPESPEVAAARTRAGKLALSMYNTRFGRADAWERGRDREDEDEDGDDMPPTPGRGAPVPPRPSGAMDLSRLSPEELATFREASRTVQALMRKARGEG